MTCKEGGKCSPCKAKKQYKETVPEEVQTLKLLEKVFKLAIINVFKELKEIISKNKYKNVLQNRGY